MKVIANTRQTQGTSASRRLRRADKVPGIVYGGAAGAAPIELDHNPLFHALRKEKFHASVLTMELDGKEELVLLRSFQMHAYKPQVLHVDFQRVDANQALHTKVPFHFINAEVSPAVKLGGAIISHVLTELEITCLPAALPQFIEVDLKDLLPGASVHLADIKLPKGVTYVPHGGDANPLLAATAVVKGGAAADEGAAEAPAA